MCTGAEMMMIAGATATVASAAMAPKMPGVQAPEKPPQQAKTPDRNTLLTGNKVNPAIAGMAGNASTFLTGASGVDMSSLNLGRSTLLGQ